MQKPQGNEKRKILISFLFTMLSFAHVL